MQETKAKAYIEVWQLIQTLKRSGARTTLESSDAASGAGLLQAVKKLRRYLHPSQHTDSRYRILQPIPALPALAADLEVLIGDLEEKLDSSEDEPSRVTIGIPLNRRLREYIGKLETEFEQLIDAQYLFIGPSRASQYEFLTIGSIGNTRYNAEVFGCLPRLAQTYLRDAGRCLTYEMPGASVGLSLRAVETTLRYYFHRLLPGEPGGQDWGPMLNRLRGSGLWNSPARNQLTNHYQECFNALDRLRDRYRNSIAHGRALLETGKEDVQSDAEEIFDQCWKAIRLLVRDTHWRSELTIRIRIYSQFDFDAAVAAYLFRWNPEYPDSFQYLEDGTFSSVEFDLHMNPAELHDRNMGSNGVLRAENGKALCQRVMAHMHVEEEFSATLEPLLSYVLARKTGRRSSKFTASNPRRSDVDVFDLFEGLRHVEILELQNPGVKTDEDEVSRYEPLYLKDKPGQLLAATWRMLDEFVATGGNLEGTNLVTNLKQEAAYLAFCQRSSEGDSH